VAQGEDAAHAGGRGRGIHGTGGRQKAFRQPCPGRIRRDELVPIGNVGSGFTARDLEDIRERLDSLVREGSPFRATPEANTAITWVKPELVCEVGLAGWTGDNLMRQPVFLRLREDKNARDVVREKAESQKEPS